MAMTPDKFPRLVEMDAMLSKEFALFAKSIPKQYELFGDDWAADFERELKTTFDTDSLRSAVKGYAKFALEALRLQKKFDLTQKYENKTYEQASQEVYLNERYMKDLYLPGLLLSHYMWPHHYRQKIWMTEKFLPLVKNGGRFCDVGVGTGFYSRYLLQYLPDISGFGFDISRFSLESAQDLIKKSGLNSRYQVNEMLIEEWKGEKFDVFLSVEVLEHLSDPMQYLRYLASVLKSGAYGVITAAIDAPNRDHIYLYRHVDEIGKQISEAGFKIIDVQNFAAFEKSKDNPTVPQNGCFIVQRTVQ